MLDYLNASGDQIYNSLNDLLQYFDDNVSIISIFKGFM